ncbi:TerD family protein [Thermobifida halotolerans]|uniref:TerD family protein n=1 Tax=Thermobifida halotolerans TaxID=483545 RepID=A0AA97LYF4_9ACTN|nr:TerD family protein [Thermobifida halotolerans]UOE20374.1 TerD family protein [Thermobifida halotolerans]
MLTTQIIRTTLRVPAPEGEPGDGAAAARQLDAALLRIGFKCSRELLEHLSGLRPETVIDTAVRVLAAVREAVGDHVAHNVYFRDFPANVPDTVEFWLDCLSRALTDPADEGVDGRRLLTAGGIDLLALPSYGRYQHSWSDLLAAHDDLVPSVKDRVSVLHLGRPLPEEAHARYLALAASPVPLNDEDLRLLETLAAYCVDAEQPRTVPVRENRALVNRVRLTHDRPLLVDTVTDVLRLACALSGGDVTLAEPTRFRSLARRDRRALLAALDRVVGAAPAKLADVNRFADRWKRLGESLHPHEHPRLPHAQEVFAVARGDRRVRSLAARVELALADGGPDRALPLLVQAPGMLVRALDRLLRLSAPERADAVVAALADTVGQVSGRVLLAAREHLTNRALPGTARLFVNRTGRAWTVPDGRPPLDRAVVDRVNRVLDDEIARRLPAYDLVLVDPAVRTAALPRSGKAVPGGFGVLPRGSVTSVDGRHLRFFVHWTQQRSDTDFDLSVLLLNDDFQYGGQVSWTSLSGYGAVHSGDIVEAPAPEGATEMIDLDLSRVPARYVVPQVNVYSGEGFDQVAESFFGYMTRDGEQEGLPFEPRTVRVRSDLRGSGQVVLPLVFARDASGVWTARWTHLVLSGEPRFNRVEGNRVSTALLARSILEREYLTVGHLADLMRRNGAEVASPAGRGPRGRTAYVGLERPEDLPDGVDVFTPDRWSALVPE